MARQLLWYGNKLFLAFFAEMLVLAKVNTHQIEPVCCGVIVCDTVIREHGTGKLSYIGCFSVIGGGQFPFQSPPFFITPMLSNLQGEIKEAINLVARVEQPGTGLVAGSGHAKIQTAPGQKIPKNEVIEISCPLVCVFPSPGEYAIVILLNN